jgi:phosphoenolpyruvate-protein phosphotransferase
MSTKLDLVAPFSGPVVPLTAVPDPVFAGLMMGDGLAIEPLSSTLLAPCDGVVTQLSRTAHAVTLTADNGAEVLIHIGIDTVKLGGSGFAAKIAQGERVSRGQPLIEVDLDAISHQVPSLMTMLVIANSDQFEFSQRATAAVVAGQSHFLSVTGHQALSQQESANGPETRANAIVRHAGGLHARPAAMVQSAARPFTAKVQIEFNGQSANAKSMVSLMGLGVGEDDDVLVLASGNDAAAAAAAVITALQTRTEAAHAVPDVPVQPSANLAAGLLGGVCAAPGLAVGKVVRLDAYEPEVAEQAADAAEELSELARALAEVRHAIGESIADAVRRGATSESDIFTAHLALLDDPELVSAAERAIDEGKSAGFAFRQTVRTQCKVLAALNSPLLAERASDLKDLERRVLMVLAGESKAGPQLEDASILVAEDLAPSELTRLPREKVAGIATAAGGATAHVAILARALGIPALVACGQPVLALSAGQQVVLDASSGFCNPAPDDVTLAEVRQKIAERELRRDEMLASASAAAVTLDGVHIEVAANITNETDAREGVANGADSVGLTRTEFLFIDRTEAPSVAEQLDAYQGVLNAMGGRTAIIRTLDVGGDKEVPYLPLPPEPNPALGLRGIRTGFANPLILDTQLRALLSVKPLSQLRILVPMIADVGEVIRLRERIEVLATEMGLAERPQLGVMIEVPSAAILADQLARHADFLSIGTNDLTQYTLAMDRCNATLAAQIDSMHPSLLRLIAMTVEGAKQHGKWVGVCGAMASDPEAVPVLVGLGVTELSVSPMLIPEIKTRVRSLDQNVCRREAAAMLQLSSAEAVRERVRANWPAV